MVSERDDYDSPWKEVLEHYFPAFMTFFFPAAHAEIDWSRGYEFLDNELRQVVQDAELGRRYVDKLVRVTLPGGTESWVLVHIEVQGWWDPKFAERMFVYNYRIYDRYKKPVVSLAVLADDDPDWRPSSFGFDLMGCSHHLKFPTVKLLDYAGREDELSREENPFALVTLAHLLTRATRNDMPARYAAKMKLVRLFYDCGWKRQQVIDLIAVIDWMLRLPDDLARQLWQDIEEIEARVKMQYVTSFERFGIEKGRAEGLAEGEAKGLAEGEVKGRREERSRALTRLLDRRHGPISEPVRARISGADLDTLDRWFDRALDAPTLDAVFDDATRH